MKDDPLRKSKDRGPTPYFHGRNPILDSFEKRLVDDKEKKEGTIFLVQGPPGIGKTALLAECWKKAQAKEWEVRELVVSALWNPQEMRKCLKLDAEARPVEKTMGGEGRAGFPELGLGVRGSLEATSVFDTEMPTPRDLIRKIKDPLLLILDEAQHLGEDSRITGAYKDDVRDLLNQIHNGKLGRPVILLAGGLGMTLKALEALGISRMVENCMFDMEPLKREEERVVVEDWLEKAGEATGDITHWIDTITTETYQWPRHVDSYARNAGQILKANGGRMTPELLRSVMETGRANRMEYYKGRLSGVDNDDILRLVKIFRNAQEHVPKKELLEKLGEAVFAQVVSQGVLYRKNGFYTIPIPSLHKYLTERAAHIREVEARRRQDRMDSDRDTDMGMER